MDRNNIKKRLIFWYSILWVFVAIALWEAYFIYFPNTTTTKSKWVGLFAGAIAILAASCKINEIFLYRYKNTHISKAVNKILDYSSIYIKKKYTIMLILSAILSVLLGFTLGYKFAICYVCGFIANIVSNLSANFITINGKVRISNMSDSSPNAAYKLSFDTSSAVSLITIGISICVLVILYHIYKDYQIINGFILGFCTISIADCAGGIISKKATKCANETIENIEYNLSANKNPITGLKILVNNISDITILNSDFGLAFATAIIASMTVGAEALNLQGAFFPIIIAANGVFASVLAILFTRFNRIRALKKVYIAELAATTILCSLTLYCIKLWFPDWIDLIYSIAIGAFGGFFINFLSTNFAYTKGATIKNISHSSIRGLIPVSFQTLKESFRNVIFPVFLTSCIVILSFIYTDGMEAPLLGIWGITLAILSMFATSGIIIAVNIFANVLNDSFLINEASLDKESNYLRMQNDFSRLSGVVSGLNYNFINIGSFMCTISLIIAYSVVIPLEEIDMLNPFVLACLILGTALPYLFCSLVMSGVTKTTKSLVINIKKQFRKYPQILREEMCPDNSKCINLAATNSTIQVIFYAILVCIILFVIVKVLKTEALAGLIMGACLSVLSLLVIAGNSSCATKSTRRYLEEEYANSSNSYEYATLTAANDIFTTMKDLMVPTCNILVKFLALLALTLAPLFL